MKKLFKKIYIEITNVCNLSCTFCPKTSRKPEFMSLELFKEVLEQVKEYGEYLNFHVMGEPLIHPQLGDFLDLANKAGFKVNITSNGTNIHKIKDTLIKSPALRQINFSLHSFEANELNCTMIEYLNNIFDFVDEAIKSRQLYVAFRLWNLTDEQGVEKNRFILNEIEKYFLPSTNLEEALKQSDRVRIKENVFLNIAKVFDWPDIDKEVLSEKGYCYGLRNQIAILVDGTVVPCCLDSEGTIALGNLNDKSISEILEGEKASAIYEGFSKREVVEDLCKKCGYRHRF